MIPQRFINEWRGRVAWQTDALIEQDLVICRALTEIYSHPVLAERIAFRGGTALHKLFLLGENRYSEDIDLVQIQPEPIGETFDHLRDVLDPWLGTPQRKLKDGRANLYYRFKTEGITPINLRLKIEINTREHYSMMPYHKVNFQCNSSWYKKEAEVTTFHLNELLATKLRALYQRKKGRDLYDLAMGINHPDFNGAVVVANFEKYLAQENKRVTKAIFEENLFHKLCDPVFTSDIYPLLTPNSKWDPEIAAQLIHQHFLSRLSGEDWAGVDEALIRKQSVVQISDSN